MPDDERTPVPNARFWIWTNAGWVKLTLRPGQSLAHCYGGRHDEGYTYSRDEYHHTGERVECQHETNASDCDGRLDRFCVTACPLDQLDARDMHGKEQARAAIWGADATLPEFNENQGILAPEWERVSRHQRDYAAEAMGY